MFEKRTSDHEVLSPLPAITRKSNDRANFRDATLRALTQGRGTGHRVSSSPHFDAVRFRSEFQCLRSRVANDAKRHVTTRLSYTCRVHASRLWEELLTRHLFTIVKRGEELTAWRRAGPAFIHVYLSGNEDSRRVHLTSLVPRFDFRLFVRETRRSMLDRLRGDAEVATEASSDFDERFTVQTSDDERLRRLAENTRLLELSGLGSRVDLRVSERRDEDLTQPVQEISLNATATMEDASHLFLIFEDLVVSLSELPDAPEALIDTLRGLPRAVGRTSVRWNPDCWRREIVVKLFWSTDIDIRREVLPLLPGTGGVFARIVKQLLRDLLPAMHDGRALSPTALIECLGGYVVEADDRLYEQVAAILVEAPRGSHLLERFERYLQGRSVEHLPDLDSGERAAFVLSLLMVVEDGLPFLAVNAVEALGCLGATRALPWLREAESRLRQTAEADRSRVRAAIAALERLQDLPRGARAPEAGLPRATRRDADDAGLPQVANPLPDPPQGDGK